MLQGLGSLARLAHAGALRRACICTCQASACRSSVAWQPRGAGTSKAASQRLARAGRSSAASSARADARVVHAGASTMRYTLVDAGDVELEPLAQRSADRSAHCVRLPAGEFGELVDRAAGRGAQHRDQLGLLGACGVGRGRGRGLACGLGRRALLCRATGGGLCGRAAWSCGWTSCSWHLLVEPPRHCGGDTSNALFGARIKSFVGNVGRPGESAW